MLAKELLEDNNELFNRVRRSEDLIRQVKNKEDGISNYCVFLGAGASVTSGIKTANELIKDWKIEVFEEINKKNMINIKM